MTEYGKMIVSIVRFSSMPRAAQDELLDSWFEEYKPAFYERGGKM